MPRPPVEPPQQHDTAVNYRLQNPPELRSWRQRLFSLDEPISMTISDYDTYFPYVSNVWKLNQRRKRKREADGASIANF